MAQFIHEYYSPCENSTNSTKYIISLELSWIGLEIELNTHIHCQSQSLKPAQMTSNKTMSNFKKF